MKKNRALLEKTEHALHQHSMITILIGRFVGPTRPLVPVAGMLIAGGQVRATEYYRLPALAAALFPSGHSRRAAIDIPADENSASFKWLLLGGAGPGWRDGCAGGCGGARNQAIG